MYSIANDTSDLGIALISENAERRELYDFRWSFGQYGYEFTFVGDHCKNDNSDIFLTKYLPWATLLLFLGFFISITVTLAVVMHMKKVDLLAFFTITLFCQQANPTDDQKTSQKTIFTVAIFAGMVTFNIFSADLASKIATRKCGIKSISDLLDHSNGFTLALYNTQVKGKSPTWVNLFTNLYEYDPYQQFTHGSFNCSSCLIKTSSAEVLMEVLFSPEKTFAIITGSNLRRTLRNYNYQTGRLISFNYNEFEKLELALPFNRDISTGKMRIINTAFIRMKEVGIYSRCQSFLNPDYPLGSTVSSSNFQPATIGQVQWAFIIYAVGALVACLICLVEIFYGKYQNLNSMSSVDSNSWAHCKTCTCTQ